MTLPVSPVRWVDDEPHCRYWVSCQALVTAAASSALALA